MSDATGGTLKRAQPSGKVDVLTLCAGPLPVVTPLSPAAVHLRVGQCWGIIAADPEWCAFCDRNEIRTAIAVLGSETRAGRQYVFAQVTLWGGALNLANNVQPTCEILEHHWRAAALRVFDCAGGAILNRLEATP